MTDTEITEVVTPSYQEFTFNGDTYFYYTNDTITTTDGTEITTDGFEGFKLYIIEKFSTVE